MVSPSKYPVKTLWIYLGANGFVSIFLVTSFVIYSSKKINLTEVEVAETDFKTMKKEVLKSSILSGIKFGIFIYLWGGLIYYFTENTSFNSYLSSSKHIKSAFFGALFFGVSMFIVSRLRINKMK